jgi:hypothetical protein
LNALKTRSSRSGIRAPAGTNDYVCIVPQPDLIKGRKIAEPPQTKKERSSIQKKIVPERKGWRAVYRINIGHEDDMIHTSC